MVARRTRQITSAEWRVGAKVKVIKRVPYLPFQGDAFDFEGPVVEVIKRLQEVEDVSPGASIRRQSHWSDYEDGYVDDGYIVDAWRPLTDEELELWEAYIEKDKHNRAIERERRAKERAKAQAAQERRERKEYERLQKKFGATND